MSSKIYDTSTSSFKESETPKIYSSDEGAFIDSAGKVYSGGAWEDAWEKGGTGRDTKWTTIPDFRPTNPGELGPGSAWSPTATTQSGNFYTLVCPGGSYRNQLALKMGPGSTFSYTCNQSSGTWSYPGYGSGFGWFYAYLCVIENNTITEKLLASPGSFPTNISTPTNYSFGIDGDRLKYNYIVFVIGPPTDSSGYNTGSQTLIIGNFSAS